MPAAPQHVTVSLRPERRVAVMPVQKAVRHAAPEVLAYPHVLYSAHHTTAGFLDAETRTQIGANAEAVHRFLKPYHVLFPYGAGYQHDQMHLRTELRPEQRRCEPRNADAHLVYMGAGLVSCTHTTPEERLSLIDLDGVNHETEHHRTRRVTAVGFSEATPVDAFTIPVPAPQQPVGTTSLRDPRLGLMAQIQAALTEHAVSYGCVRLALTGPPAGAALVVNEYEPQLMQHDLTRVLRAPHAFSTAACVPAGAEQTSASEVAPPPVHTPEDLRLSAALRLMVRPPAPPAGSQIVQGRYQSPILLHWTARPRTVQATVMRYT